MYKLPRLTEASNSCAGEEGGGYPNGRMSDCQEGDAATAAGWSLPVGGATGGSLSGTTVLCLPVQHEHSLKSQPPAPRVPLLEGC